MSKYTVRHEVPVEIGGQTYKVLIREIPYQKFVDINNGVGLPEKDRGIEIMKALCVACMEEADGKPSFTDETWVQEPLSAQVALYRAALKTHGINMDIVADEKPLTPEEAEGNA